MSRFDSRQDKILLNNNKSKAKATREVKEVKVVRVNSSQIRSKDTFSLTKMMSWVIHHVCTYQSNIMIAVTAKEETITLSIMKERKWITIIRGTGLSIATQATNDRPKIIMRDQTAII